MHGSRHLAPILEALDRVQHHVTVYLAQVRDTFMGLHSLGKIRDLNFVLPAMTAESLGLPTISDAIERYASSASTTRVTKSWAGDRLLRTTALSGLEPMSVYYWAQAAKAYVSEFVPRLDEEARAYLSIENARDVIVAMEGATIINRSSVDGSFNGLLAPTLSLGTRNRLFRNNKGPGLPPIGTLLEHLDVEPGWEVVRPRVKALGDTIDAPRPSRFLTADIFGLQSPDRTVVKTAIQDILDITPSHTKDFLQAVAGSPPLLTFNSFQPKRYFPGFESELLKPPEQSKPTAPDVSRTGPSQLTKYALPEPTSFEIDGSSKAGPVTAFRRKFPTPLSTYGILKPPLFGVDAGFESKAPKSAEQSTPTTTEGSKAGMPPLESYDWLKPGLFENNGEHSKADPAAPFRRKLSPHRLLKSPLDQPEPIEKVKPPEPGSPPTVPSWKYFTLGSLPPFSLLEEPFNPDDPLQFFNRTRNAKGKPSK